MSTPNRNAVLAKLQKVLRKHYKPVEMQPARPVMELMLLACCLENATFEDAEAAIKALSTTFFDWNEVRVSTIKELAEVMSMLPDANGAAIRLRGVLQGIFETTYSFDVDALKKQNLGQALKRIEKLPGVSSFVLAFTTQMGLGGHSIPVDAGTLELLWIVGVIGDVDKKKQQVPGLDRAIPKSKGIEFFTLLHQLGAEVHNNPYSTKLHKILLEVAPDAKSRLPKRLTKKQLEAQEAAAKAAAAAAAQAKIAAEKARAEQAKSAKAAPAKAQPPAARPLAGKPATKPEKGKPPEAADKKKGAPPAKPVSPKPAPLKKASDKTPVAKKPSLPPAKVSAGVKKSATANLAKRKPR